MKGLITKNNWIIFVFAFGFAVFIIGGVIYNISTDQIWSSTSESLRDSDMQQPQESSLHYYSEALAKRIVLHNLKAPKGADFGGIQSDLSGGHSDIEVTGYVDAQNSYGADIRTRFKITLWFNGDYEDEAYDDSKWIVQDQQYDPH